MARYRLNKDQGYVAIEMSADDFMVLFAAVGYPIRETDVLDLDEVRKLWTGMNTFIKEVDG